MFVDVDPKPIRALFSYVRTHLKDGQLVIMDSNNGSDETTGFVLALSLPPLLPLLPSTLLSIFDDESLLNTRYSQSQSTQISRNAPAEGPTTSESSAELSAKYSAKYSAIFFEFFSEILGEIFSEILSETLSETFSGTFSE